MLTLGKFETSGNKTTFTAGQGYGNTNYLYKDLTYDQKAALTQTGKIIVSSKAPEALKVCPRNIQVFLSYHLKNLL